MGMDMFGGNGGMNNGMNSGMNNGMNSGMNNLVSSMNGPSGGMDMRGSAVGSGNSMRNQPILSFGNHRMSRMGRMSEVSYGRAMSGLSALSIDWENLEDFD